MIDYMMESIITNVTFIVCWGALTLLTMNVIERIDKNKKKKNKVK